MLHTDTHTQSQVATPSHIYNKEQLVNCLTILIPPLPTTIQRYNGNHSLMGQIPFDHTAL